MEYIVFPTFAVLFQLKFPINASFPRRFVHYVFWVGMILAFMLVIGQFTNMMDVKWDNLIRSFFNFLIELWLCRRYVLWMIKDLEVKKVRYL
nr:hypothetical protein [Bacillus pinisoli]